MVDLKAKLSGMTHQVDDLAKENALLKSEVATVHEHMGKVKEEAIDEYQGSQPYFNEMEGYYGMVSRTFKTRLSLCSQTWTSPKSRSGLLPRQLLLPSQFLRIWRLTKRWK